ncbi:MAG: hypothetical protein IPL19_26775 [Sandaracinaceae bacterium]|nr:hypothetical protein [Sandaracinaceae bacterium]
MPTTASAATHGLTRTPLQAGLWAGLVEGEASCRAMSACGTPSGLRGRLVTCCNAPIEQRVPDAPPAALVPRDDTAHVIAACRVRAYLWRMGEHCRLTPDNEQT